MVIVQGAVKKECTETRQKSRLETHGAMKRNPIGLRRYLENRDHQNGNITTPIDIINPLPSMNLLVKTPSNRFLIRYPVV
jgi:hypothetical protein